MKCSNVLILTMAVLLMGGVASAQWTEGPDADVVYVSDPANGTILKIYEGEGGLDETTVLNLDGVYFEDIVIGPDLRLYACGVVMGFGEGEGCVECDGDYFDDDAYGIVLRFDPDDPENTLEVVYVGFESESDLAFPRGPWFNHMQDLVVTDGAPGGGLWVFPEVATVPYDGDFPDPTQLVTRADLGDDGAEFEGQGVTQSAEGELLFVDQGNGLLRGLAYDPMTMTWDPSVGLDTLVTDLEYPFGVARLSTGEVFVSDGVQLLSYDKNGDEYCSPVTFEIPDNGSCTSYPVFFEVTANDWIYVATMDECTGDGTYYTGSLWVVDPNNNPDNPAEDCSAQHLFMPDVDTLWGLALPPTNRTITLAEEDLDSGDLVFDFADHIHEVTALEPCTASMTAFETPPSCLDAIVPDETADAVLYLGEGGFGTAYHVPANECAPPAGGAFLHAVSAYTDLLDNPTIVRCDGIANDLGDICDSGTWVEDCELLDLASFFPFDGDLPDDGRIGSKGSASFSLYFLVDYGLAGPNGEATAAWCGFRPPVKNAFYPTDPMSTFREGRSVPLKFKVADGPDFDCQRGPFVAPEGILLSIARVDPDFEVQEIVCSGGGCGEAPYFEAPNNARRGFHMNVRTDDFEPGIYQAVLVATGGEFPVAWTYFEIID